MDPHPTIIRPTDKISTAARFIMEKRYRSLPVVDENGCYLGVFGVNCLLKQVLPNAALIEKGLTNVSFIHDSLAELHERFREFGNQPVSICISNDIKTIAPDTPLIETLLLLYTHRASIPGCRAGKLQAAWYDLVLGCGQENSCLLGKK